MFKSFTINSFLSFLSGCIGLLSYILFIKYESVAVLGIWSTVAIVITFSQFVEYGITDGITIEIANKENNKEKLFVAINSIFFFVVFGLFLSAIAIVFEQSFFLLANLKDDEFGNVSNLYKLCCLSMILSSVISGLRAILYGFNYHFLVNRSLLISRYFQFLVLIYFLYNDYSFYSFIFSLFAFQGLMLFLQGMLFFKLSKNNNETIILIKLSSLLYIIKSSKEMFIVKGSQKVFVDEGFKILLSRYFGAETVGAYATAFSAVQIYRKMVDVGSKIMINISKTLSNKEMMDGIRKIYVLFFIPLIVIVNILTVFFVLNYRTFPFFNDFERIFNFIIPLIVAYSINIFANPHYYILMGRRDFGSLIKCSVLSISVLYISSILYFPYLINAQTDSLIINQVIPYCLMILISSIYVIFKSYRNLEKI